MLLSHALIMNAFKDFVCIAICRINRRIEVLNVLFFWFYASAVQSDNQGLLSR